MAFDRTLPSSIHVDVERLAARIAAHLGGGPCELSCQTAWWIAIRRQRARVAEGAGDVLLRGGDRVEGSCDAVDQPSTATASAAHGDADEWRRLGRGRAVSSVDAVSMSAIETTNIAMISCANSPR